MEGKMHVITWLDEKQQHVGIQINEGEKAWGHITLEAPELSGFIEKLGMQRAKLSDQVASEVERGWRFQLTADPAWAVVDQQPELPPNAATLLLRHPGYGWLAFGLPQHEAKAMGEALVRSASGQPPDPSTR